MSEHNALVGANLHIARSAVDTGSPVGVVTPGIVGQFYIDDTTNTLWRANGLTAADWVEVASSGGSTTKKLSWGHFTIAIANGTDWTQVNWPPLVNAYAADHYTMSGEYFDGFWDIYEVDDSGVNHGEHLDNQFADVAALYTYVRANCTESIMNPGRPMYHIRVHSYEKISSAIAPIDKMYGQNTFYAMLRGRKNYKVSMYYCGWKSGIMWGNFPTWFADLCNQNCGFGPGTTYSSGDEAALWLSRNTRGMYGMPKPGFDSEIMVVAGRRIFDWGASSFSPATAVGHNNNAIGGTTAQIACFLVKNNPAFWQWCDPTSLSEYIPLLSGPEYSGIMLYQIGDTTDPNKRAMFVKPIGIDRVGLTWFSLNDYDLYAVHTRRDFQPVLRKITTTGLDTPSKDLLWVERPNWRLPQQYYPTNHVSMKQVGIQPFRIRFFIRDKTTSEISALSHASIAVAERQRGVPYKFEVRS